MATAEGWLGALQAETDKITNKLDTGALSLRKSVDTMGGLLESMERQRGEIGASFHDAPIMASLDPDTIERLGGGRAFLSPFTPLVHQLSKSFNKEELSGLAADAGIDIEHVGGSGLLDICRRLVGYARRLGKLDDLLHVAAMERPKVDWTKLRVAPDEVGPQ